MRHWFRMEMSHSILCHVVKIPLWLSVRLGRKFSHFSEAASRFCALGCPEAAVPSFSFFDEGVPFSGLCGCHGKALFITHILQTQVLHVNPEKSAASGYTAEPSCLTKPFSSLYLNYQRPGDRTTSPTIRGKKR